MGGVATLIGASLPSIVREMDWSYRVAGILLAGNAGAYFVSTLISGWFLGRWGARQLMVLGLLQQGVGIFLFGWTSQWTVAVGLLVWVGFGQGMLEVSANGSVILMDTSGSGRLMNLLHAGFTGLCFWSSSLCSQAVAARTQAAAAVALHFLAILIDL